MQIDMKLHLQRKYRKDKYIIGNLYIDDVFFCNVIEDRDRGLTQDMPLSEIKKIKVMHETAIPYGTYKVSLTYSPKFKRILPLIENVPGFTGIRIHSGNTESDSSGCLVVGENKVKGKVINSKITLEKLLKKLENQSNITIEITK